MSHAGQQTFNPCCKSTCPKEGLKKWLYSYNYFLDILQSLNIFINVASALEYLRFGY